MKTTKEKRNEKKNEQNKAKQIAIFKGPESIPYPE